MIVIEKEKAAFFTGPRPQNLYGSKNPYEERNKRLLLVVRGVIIEYIEELGIDTFITGMALGIDLWLARIVLKLKEDEKYKHIRLIGAIPCLNQPARWEDWEKAEWEKVYRLCDAVIYVTHSNYTKDCMFKRNRWMVDHALYGIGVYSERARGTKHCLRYAREQRRKVTVVNAHTLEVVNYE